MVSCLKRFKSSGNRHGMPLSRPMTPFRAMAATREMRGEFTKPALGIAERRSDIEESEAL